MHLIALVIRQEVHFIGTTDIDLKINLPLEIIKLQLT